MSVALFGLPEAISHQQLLCARWRGQSEIGLAIFRGVYEAQGTRCKFVVVIALILATRWIPGAGGKGYIYLPGVGLPTDGQHTDLNSCNELGPHPA